MRVLVVTDRTETVGGVEIYISRLQDLLENAGHEVVVFGGTESSRFVRPYIRSTFSIRYFLRVRQTIANFSPDVLFGISVCGNVSPSTLLAGWMKNIPVIYQIPNLNRFDKDGIDGVNPSELFAYFRQVIQRGIIGWTTTKCVAPSETAAAYLQERVKCTDVVTIPHPVFWSLAGSLTIPNSPPLQVLYVGRLHKKKGVDHLLKAIGRLENSESVELAVYGDGPRRSRLEQLCDELNIRDSVQFEGWIDHEALRTLYRDAAVTIFPSLTSETFGLTVLESMSQGTPVIASDLGGHNELVTDGEDGLIVPPGDIGALATAIERLTEDKLDISDMSESALKTANQYTTGRHVAEIESLLRDVQKE